MVDYGVEPAHIAVGQSGPEGRKRMDPYSSARAKLTALVSSLEPDTDMNEATTRLRVINGLLMDCLGWPPEEIDAEAYHNGDYADYALGKLGTEVILEAKREGITFELPSGIEGRRAIDISTLMQNDATKQALLQVLRYCQDRGVPIAVICNGRQLVAFYASRQDGVPPMEGRALAFSSLQEMLDDFGVLWSHLSRDGIAERNLQRFLFGKTIRAMPARKLSDSVVNYPGFRPRTALETDLKMLGGLFIQDLESEESISQEFLTECYCSSGALSQYALVSKEILRARYSAIKEVSNIQTEPARTKKGVNPGLSADVMTAALSRRPLILLGDVGVGKTMFLRHLIEVDAIEAIEKSFVLYVNFGTEPALETNLEEYVYRRMTEQLLGSYALDIGEADFVRAVYNADLNRFKRGIYGTLQEENPQEYRRHELDYLAELTKSHATHLKNSLQHIRATSSRTSIVVLDNIDQRPREFQDRVFLIAQSLAESWPATVFVSLRPTTFYESKSSGSLAAYQLRVFTVEPTRVDDVVSRRLRFAKKQLEASTTEGSFPANLSLSGEDLIAYVDVLIKAFTENENLKSLLDNLSGGNLRLALTFLSAFVGSGYVSTQRVLDTAEQGGIYVIPLHEFTRAMIYGEYEHFDPNASEICNLLDVTTDDGREHFLLPLILAHVQRVGESARTDGFVDAGSIYDAAQGWGYQQEQVGAQLKRAVDKRLIESVPGRKTGGPFRISSIGSYMYKSMIASFSYLDAMTIDTPISDVTYRNKILMASSITDRVARCKIFAKYLDEQWERLGLTSETDFSWPTASASLSKEIAEVSYRAARAAQTPRS